MLETYFEGLKERASAQDWKLEILVLSMSVVVTVLYFIGNYLNSSKFTKWINYEAATLADQFAHVGIGRKAAFHKDDDQHYVSYATGRINVAQFIIKVTLQPRQNITLWIMENLLGSFISVSPVEDEVSIVAKFHDDVEVDPFIFAFVNKECMSKARDDNYYLSLTRTTDSAQLPLEFVYMSENNDLNEIFYKEFGDRYKEFLTKAKDVLKILAFTDQKSVHPFSLEEAKPNAHAELKLFLKSDKASLEATSEVLNFFLEMIDFVCSKKFVLKPETQKKIAKIRDAENKKLNKMIEQDKREQLEEKRMEELKKQKEKLKGLSTKELEKLEKKQREKQQRKMMKKQRVKG